MLVLESVIFSVFVDMALPKITDVLIAGTKVPPGSIIEARKMRESAIFNGGEFCIQFSDLFIFPSRGNELFRR